MPEGPAAAAAALPAAAAVPAAAAGAPGDSDGDGGSAALGLADGVTEHHALGLPHGAALGMDASDGAEIAQPHARNGGQVVRAIRGVAP